MQRSSVTTLTVESSGGFARTLLAEPPGSGLEARRPEQEGRQARQLRCILALLTLRRGTGSRAGRIERSDRRCRLMVALALARRPVLAIGMLALAVMAFAAAMTATMATAVIAALTTAPAAAVPRRAALDIVRVLIVRGRRLAGPRDRLPDQLLDRADRFLVDGRHDGERHAAAAGAAGAADAMDIVVGMMRD